MTSLIFFGADQYSAIVLGSLLKNKGPAKLQRITVVTDQQTPPSPVESLATEHQLPISYYKDFAHSVVSKDALGLCASFDHLIPQDIIDLFAGRLYNLHPSLLPEYRNVSPVQYALALGDQVTGITLFRIAPGIDDGPIISQTEVSITKDDTTHSLTTRLFALGAQLFLDFLQGSVPCKLVKKNKVRNLVFTHRLTRDSGYIEWGVLHRLLQNEPVSPDETKNELLSLRLEYDHREKSDSTGTNILHALVRALTPWPTVWSTIPTKNRDLRLTLESVLPKVKIKIAGKPRSISYPDFAKYYL